MNIFEQISALLFFSLEPVSQIEDLEWLEIFLEPWDEVQEKWKNTLSDRKALFEKNDTFTVNAYYKKFPCLKTQNGYHLVSSYLKFCFDKKSI